MPRDTADRLAIRDLIENWVLWRDARMWDRFRTVWHKDGQMWATWFQGSYEDFIRVSQEGYDRGVRIMHMLGGMSIDIKGRRAIAQTKMTISQRAKVEGVLCDVVCSGRFYDFLEKRKGRWGIVLRRLAYEKDRIDPVEPDAKLTLDKAHLAQFPEGYRHLAYLQSKIGYTIKDELPGLDGAPLAAWTCSCPLQGASAQHGSRGTAMADPVSEVLAGFRDGLGDDLARAALALARRFAAGATLWCLAPGWPEHARHVAVEFVHPVIMGKRALPAVTVDDPAPVAALRARVRAGDVVVLVSTADVAAAVVRRPPRPRLGRLDDLDRRRRAPRRRSRGSRAVARRCRRRCRARRSPRAAVPRAVGTDPRLLRASRPADARRGVRGPDLYDVLRRGAAGGSRGHRRPRRRRAHGDRRRDRRHHRGRPGRPGDLLLVHAGAAIAVLVDGPREGPADG